MCPLDVEVHSEMFVNRIYETLNETVRSRALSIIMDEPSKTPVYGPLEGYVRRCIQTTTPEVTTPAEYSVDLGQVELTQVMKQWMNFENIDELP
jgi:hypothetical protein